jgi:hypothetical protein
MAPGATDVSGSISSSAGRPGPGSFPPPPESAPVASLPASSSPSSPSGQAAPLTWANFLCATRHPVASFFHIAFKTSALVLYMFQSLIGIDYVTCFISVTLLLAADFWAVKNVTGRLLVGLRWWNRMREDGQNEWIFESSPTHADVPALDRRVFWWSLYLAPSLFSLFFVAAFLSLSWDWALVAAMAAGLTGANLIGYIRCSSDAQKRIQATLAAGSAFGGFPLAAGVSNAFGAVGTSVLSSFLAGGAGSAVAASGAVAAMLGAAGAAAGGAGGVGGSGAAATSISSSSSSLLSSSSSSAASSSRQAATRGAPGAGIITDFDAVADPFGSRSGGDHVAI